MSDQESRQIQQQGQSDQASARMTQVGALGSSAEEQGNQPGGQYGGLGLDEEQTGLQTPEQAAAPVQAALWAAAQAAAQQAPVQAVRREGPPPVFEAAVIERREGGFGGATIRILDRGLAATAIVGAATVGATYVASQATQSPSGIAGAGFVAGAMSLAAFYMGNRQQTDEAIRRAVERERHIQVENIEEGSLLVHVKFLTLAGYWVLRSFNEKIHHGTDRTCLQLLLEDELQRIGWTGPIQVELEGWSFSEEEGQKEEQEKAAETEQKGEIWEWARMMEKQSEDSGLSEDVSSVSTMSITSDEDVQEGPLKWQRARLQMYKTSPTAKREIKAYSSWEEGPKILTSSGYADIGGVKALVKGFMLRDMLSPDGINTLLYEESWLNLTKAPLKQLMTSQLQADPTDSTCLLLTALQLPHGNSRVQTLQQVVDAILQHGTKDWLYQHLHHIYCYLGWGIWKASPQPKPKMISKLFKGSDLTTTNLPARAKALSTMASSLMYKGDHLETVYYTAVLSKEVSETAAIKQFEHFLRLAPECNLYVPNAHYCLATLYKQQRDSQKVIHHFKSGQQREANSLPGFSEVPRAIKDPAEKAYEHVMLLEESYKQLMNMEFLPYDDDDDDEF